MLLRIAYCDDEIENGKKIRDYINQLMIQIEVEFELDFYVSGTVLLENVKKQNDYYDIGEGQGAIFHFTVGYVDGVKKSAWLVSRYKF